MTFFSDSHDCVNEYFRGGYMVKDFVNVLSMC